MKFFKPYYLIALIIGGWIFWFNAQGNKQPEEFFGFAENRETEVNFNYPVVVKRIHVNEGKEVVEGDLLFHLQRVQPRKNWLKRVIGFLSYKLNPKPGGLNDPEH